MQQNTNTCPRCRELEARIAVLERRLAEQERQIAALMGLLEEARRAGKRQAAPFSRKKARSDPKPPGRKTGQAYGRRGERPVPKRVDEKVVVPCPLWCPHCESPVKVSGTARQYQVDIPRVRTRTTLFEIHFGTCTSCGRRVQGRDAKQTSDSVQVGRVQIGPEAVAAAAHLNKVGGLSYGKVAETFDKLFGLKVGRSTLARALARLARKAEPTYAALVGQVQSSPIVYPDETGWRIGGRGAWLWAVTNRRVTVYSILKGRGFEQAASILGRDYPGIIGSDGWAPYRRFPHATRQACLAHLLRRCEEMREVASGGAVRFPGRIKALLKDALTVRDLWRQGVFRRSDVTQERLLLEADLDEALGGAFCSAENRRFAKHLRRLRPDLFRFLDDPRLEATNWPAEQAIRPAVVNRKTCGGGNRTINGARTQSVLMSVLRSCQQQSLDTHGLLVDLLHYPSPRSLTPLAAR